MPDLGKRALDTADGAVFGCPCRDGGSTTSLRGDAGAGGGTGGSAGDEVAMGLGGGTVWGGGGGGKV